MPAVQVPDRVDWVDTYERRKTIRALRRLLRRPWPWLLYGGAVGLMLGTAGAVGWVLWAG